MFAGHDDVLQCVCRFGAALCHRVDWLSTQGSGGEAMKVEYQVPGGDFDRAGEASANIKKLLQRIGIPADVIRRIAIGTYEGEMNCLIHAGGGLFVA